MAVAADTLLVSLAAGAERSGRRQPAVEAMTACAHLVTATRLASADATRFYKSTISTIIGGCGLLLWAGPGQMHGRTHIAAV